MTGVDLSLIISFYNKPEYLELIFSSLERQSFKNFEVIIADDGSNAAVVEKLSRMIQLATFPIQHIWHEDIGWRKTMILNKAVQASHSDYLVFIDGDCILHKNFLEEHYNNRHLGNVLAGRRVNMSQNVSSLLTHEKVSKGHLERRLLLNLLFDRLIQKHGSHTENAIYIRNNWLRRFFNKKDKGILGANFSLFKSDLLLINGFDERYIYPAYGEDTDIDFRLRLKGVKIRSLKHIAIQYHMYHKTLDRPSENSTIYNETVAKRISYTRYGIKKL